MNDSLWLLKVSPACVLGRKPGAGKELSQVKSWLMKSVFILLLLGSCLLAKTQSSPPPAQQQATDEVQLPGEGAPPQGSSVASIMQVYAYPKANQTSDRQAQDESECYQWARGQGAPFEQRSVQQPGAVQEGQSGQQDTNKAGGSTATRPTDNVKRAYSSCMESRKYTVQ
jgi:hypothetical protein